MAESYDNLRGKEQRQEDHPDNSHTFKMPTKAYSSDPAFYGQPMANQQRSESTLSERARRDMPAPTSVLGDLINRYTGTPDVNSAIRGRDAAIMDQAGPY